MSGIPAGAGSLLGKRLGKYEILALLALGGTAEIYLARIGGAAGFEKYVVVKCLHDHLADDQEFVKMFLDEARLAAHLDHSNIVQTMELGEHENRYYMVMEFLAGLSLAMVVRRVGERLPGGRMPVPLALNIIAQACAGLHYAHERVINGKTLNIVHRDISPQNLVISFEGVVKVVDFGIAKAELRETKTRSGTIKGKFAYMSPEQCVATNVDRRTDVFALGVITWELLTGRRLFKKNSPYETYQAVIECAVDPPSRLNHELDPALDAIVMKAIAKDKDDRYPTAEAFGDAILGYLHHRAKGSGPGEVARFFDQQFAQEIEEHGARMRELISGQEDFSVDTGAGWDEQEGRADETRDIGVKKAQEESISLSAADLVALDRPSQGGISDVIGSLHADEAPLTDDGEPPDRTRIEANPLDRINELNAAAAKQAAPAPKGKASGAHPTVALQPNRATTPPPTRLSGGPGRPTTNPPATEDRGPNATSAAALGRAPTATPASRATPAPASGRTTGPASASGPGGAGRATTNPPPLGRATTNPPPLGRATTNPPPLGRATTNPPPLGASATTNPPPGASPGALPLGRATPPLGQNAPRSTGAPPTVVLQPQVPPSSLPLGGPGPSAEPAPPQTHQQHKMPPSGPLPLPAPPTGPMSPLVAKAQPNMATQMVQVDAPAPTPAPAPAQAGARPGFPNFSHLPTMIADPEPPEQASTVLDRAAYPDTPPPQPAPAGPGPQRPSSSSAPPQSLPTSYPVMNAELSNAMRRSGDVFPSGQPQYQQPLPDSGQMVQVASPVGAQYGQQVDWAQAAATPARALPRWALVAMFAGAIVGALLITLIIAKLAG